jgi:hypothetical protein
MIFSYKSTAKYWRSKDAINKTSLLNIVTVRIVRRGKS